MVVGIQTIDKNTKTGRQKHEEKRYETIPSPSISIVELISPFVQVISNHQLDEILMDIKLASH